MKKIGCLSSKYVDTCIIIDELWLISSGGGRGGGLIFGRRRVEKKIISLDDKLTRKILSAGRGEKHNLK